jgi:hypothetical protein
VKRKEAQRSGGLHGTQWRKTGDTASAREGRRPLESVRNTSLNIRGTAGSGPQDMTSAIRFLLPGFKMQGIEQWLEPTNVNTRFRARIFIAG